MALLFSKSMIRPIMIESMKDFCKRSMNVYVVSFSYEEVLVKLRILTFRRSKSLGRKGGNVTLFISSK